MEVNREEAGLLQAAEHLASRADIALRAGLRVECLSLEAPEGIVCDWRQARGSMGDDLRLIHYGFAFVLAGTILDKQQTGAISDELRKQLSADRTHTREARETAVEWGLASDIEETNPFARTGYKLASRFLHHDSAVIDQLAHALLARKTMMEDELKAWFADHAELLALAEVEQSILYE
ncbi:MAG TPA: hypothetical protein VGN16_09025 [Acidobacteriaceae bacterium]|jgi:hypothetical protein